MKRETLYKLMRWAICLLTRPEYQGTENLPASGGIIVATNHMSRLDTPLLMLNPVRPEITALVADKYKRYPFFKFILDNAGTIWIDRGKADFSAFRSAIDAIHQGQALGIAPEGTRSRTGQLLEGKPGTVLLALRADAPVVPVGISGTENAMRDILRLRKPTITAHFGKPFHLPPLSRENRNADLQRSTEEVMCRIAALLPEKYHGFYAGHPRLKELLASGDY